LFIIVWDAAMKIYFDACAINRITDDQSQQRIREEAEAVEHLLDLVAAGSINWIGSPLLTFELGQNPKLQQRQDSLLLLSLVGEAFQPTSSTRTRANLLAREGYGAEDAFHLAIAEQANADWLVTVDDRFLKRAAKRPGNPWPTVINPIDLMKRSQQWPPHP